MNEPRHTPSPSASPESGSAGARGGHAACPAAGGRWDGAFSAVYYRPYREQVDAAAQQDIVQMLMEQEPGGAESEPQAEREGRAEL